MEFFPGERRSRGEVPGATEANRRKKKKPSCNVNLKGRREVCAFNYGNISSSVKLNSTRKSLIINTAIPEMCLLANVFDRFWVTEPADRTCQSWGLEPLRTLEYGVCVCVCVSACVCVCGVSLCRMYICFHFCFSPSILENSSFLFPKINQQCPVCATFSPPSTFCLLLSLKGLVIFTLCF